MRVRVADLTTMGRAYGALFNGISNDIIYGTSVFPSDDLVVFTGGADVSPALYGVEDQHPQTHCDLYVDIKEARMWVQAKRLGIPCIGICRGGQLLNVLNGGKLIQHVDNHTTGHKVKTSDSSTFEVVSTHHQMMVPHKDAKLLCWAEGISTEYDGKAVPDLQKKGNKFMEPEVLYYAETKDLCIQFHPEREKVGSACHLYTHELIENLLKEN